MATVPQSLKTSRTQKRSPENLKNRDDEYEDAQSTAGASILKRPKLQKGLNHDNILASPQSSSRIPDSAVRANCSASIASSRSTRGSLRIHAPVNYDMRFHPADRVLRPNHAATKAARVKAGEEMDDEDEADTEDTDDDEGNQNQSSEDWSTENENMSSSPENKAKTSFAVVVPSYRATRFGRNVRAANYDMKHHPMDDILRPKASAKRSVRFKGLSSSPTPQSTSSLETEKSENAANELHQTTEAEYEDPFTNPPTTDWNGLGNLNRRLFQMQQGTPIESDVIPLSWSNVFKNLKDEQLLSHPQLGASGGYTALKAHYEEVRHAIVRLFGAEAEEEPHDIGQLEWIRAEGSRVYELSNGHRYWKHRSDSVWFLKTPNYDLYDRTADEVSPISREDGDFGEVPTTHPHFTSGHNIHAVTSFENTASVHNNMNAPNSEQVLIKALPGGLSGPIDLSMNTGHEAGLWGKDKSAQDHVGGDALADESEDGTDDIDVEQYLNIDPSSSSESDGLQFSPKVPVGAQRAARRMYEEKKRLEKADKKQTPSNPHKLNYEEDSGTSPSFRILSNLTDSAGKFKQVQGDFEILEDQPEMTPITKKQLAARRISPGIDAPKENLAPEYSNSAEAIAAHMLPHPYPAGPHVTVRRLRPTAADFL